MKITRDASKAANRFHQRWVQFLLHSSLQTQRRVCHELYYLEQANRDYLDAQFLGVLRKTLEYVIRDIGGSSWSVERSRHDLRGKTRRYANRRPIHIDGDLQRALTRRLSPIDSAADHQP
jgi:hypothetical protein